MARRISGHPELCRPCIFLMAGGIQSISGTGPSDSRPAEAPIRGRPGRWRTEPIEVHTKRVLRCVLEADGFPVPIQPSSFLMSSSLLPSDIHIPVDSNLTLFWKSPLARSTYYSHLLYSLMQFLNRCKTILETRDLIHQLSTFVVTGFSVVHVFWKDGS